MMLYSCKDEEDCTYRLTEAEYNYIPYKTGDSVIVYFNDTLTSLKDTFVLAYDYENLSTHPNFDPLGLSICNGTFESYEIDFSNNNNNITFGLSVQANEFGLSIVYISEDSFFTFYTTPYKIQYPENEFYFSQLEIDGEIFYNVYIIKYSQTVYYSTVSGLIKLETDSGVYRFETIR
jgi:hypothetical protein